MVSLSVDRDHPRPRKGEQYPAERARKGASSVADPLSDPEPRLLQPQYPWANERSRSLDTSSAYQSTARPPLPTR